MSIVSRVLAGLGSKSIEGEVREGPYFLPVSGGWLPAGTDVNWWQEGHSVRPIATHSAMVEACVSAYAQTVAMCPGDHWRRLENGGRERVTASALTRILRRPNDYQSISDFLMNATRSLYSTGSAYALAVRNSRFEISELHLMRSRMSKWTVAEDGSVYYDLGGNEIAEQRFDLSGVPARDVLHIRLHTPNHPLKGETPLRAAALEIAAGDAMLQQQVRFFLNQARPSNIVFETDQPFTKEQTDAFTALVNEKTAGMNAGKSLVLSNGLKAKGINVTSEDAQLAEMMKLSSQQVALAFRVPLPILGIGSATYSSTEQLMQSWIASGLGFALNHIEEAVGNFFGLRGYPDEYLELNTKALLRSAFKDRIDGLVKATQGGVMTVDDARLEEDLPRVPFGDQPRMQEQMVPLSYGAKKEPPAAAPPPQLALPKPESDAEEPPPEKDWGREKLALRMWAIEELQQ